MTLFGMRKFLDSLTSKAKKLPKKTIEYIENNVLQAQRAEIFEGLGQVQGASAVYPDGTNPALVGRQWQPFSNNTFKINPKRKGGRLLQDTGHMRNTVKAVRMPDGSLKWGSEYWLAKIHHYGANIKVFGKHPAKIPSRPFVFLTEKYVNRTVKYIEFQVEKMQK